MTTEAKPSPVQLPPGQQTISVKLINPTKFGPANMSRFMGPMVPELQKPEWSCSLSFLLEHPSGRKLVYDLGIRKDPENLAPKIVSYMPSTGYIINSQNVVDILEKGGIKGEEIEAVVWSHWHWDHIGDPSTFPPTTDLIVGPGFKQAMLPGAPANPDSPIQESDYANRNLREITYPPTDPKVTKIGSFPAYDYFGDGSFYLLDSPGHAIGHLCGLARTTPSTTSTSTDATFILLGGDICHYAGIFRPSPYLPLPSTITPHPCHAKSHTHSSPSTHPALSTSLCPGQAWVDLQVTRNRAPNEPLFDMIFGGDIPLATQTAGQLMELDCLDQVFVVIAHDANVRDHVPHWPEDKDESLNAWKERGWGKQLKWAFLGDLEGYWRGRGLVSGVDT